MPDLGFDVRAALLKSGKREFLECGFEKASLHSICAGAGVTTGAFYSNFRAKDDLFGAIYLVVMLVVVMLSGMIPILYLIAPLTVGIVCGTIYEMCVLKVHKFGAALILGALFALVSCTSNILSLVCAIVVAILAELVIKAGGYTSKKMYLASFVVFNLNIGRAVVEPRPWRFARSFHT